MFGETSKFGFSIEVIPDTSFVINDKLLDVTKENYTELTNAIKKYPSEKDNELIVAMNKQFKECDKEIKDVDPEKDFNISEMTFKDEKVKKLSENVKKQRLKVLWGFNKMFVSMNSYLVSEPVKSYRGMKSKNTSASSLFNEVKNMILT
jgi:hypothetical protein